MAGLYSDWDDLTLCDSTDLEKWQHNIYEFATFADFWSEYILLAKNEIKKRIWVLYSPTVSELTTTYPTDYIVNPDVLKEACIFKALCLGFADLIQFTNDENHKRSVRFCQRFEEEWLSVKQFLQVDVDGDSELDTANPIQVMFQRI